MGLFPGYQEKERRWLKISFVWVPLCFVERLPEFAALEVDLLVRVLDLGGCTSFPMVGVALEEGQAYGGILLGVLGEYIGAIHSQVRKRPLVIERERINL